MERSRFPQKKSGGGETKEELYSQTNSTVHNTTSKVLCILTSNIEKATQMLIIVITNA